ncbi:MAG: class I SAM-dependent methyltransferase [Pyramidobacter sp.]|jgi:phospholipid N-methyltransferase
MEHRRETRFLGHHSMVFFKQFMAKPGQIGSVTPSSHYLVKKMLGQTDWSQVRRVVELGAGTGVVTAQLLNKLDEKKSLTVFELDKKLRDELESSLKIAVCENAEDLPLILQPRSVDVILSSLPWTTLPRQCSFNILHGILQCLRPDGQFIAYQYSWQMYRLFKELFQSVQFSFVLRNVPPAFVYNCRKPRREAPQALTRFYDKK